MIGTEIIQRLFDVPLVIADLTGRNPNVYYELAVRHGYKKPVVQIVDRAHLPLPFDIQTTPTIIYDTTDWDSIPTSYNQMVNQINAVERNPQEVDNPIVQGFELKNLRDSSRPEDNNLADVLQELSNFRTQTSLILHRLRRFEYPLPVAGDVRTLRGHSTDNEYQIEKALEELKQFLNDALRTKNDSE